MKDDLLHRWYGETARKEAAYRPYWEDLRENNQSSKTRPQVGRAPIKPKPRPKTTYVKNKDGSITISRIMQFPAGGAGGSGGTGAEYSELEGELLLLPQRDSTDDGIPAVISDATASNLLQLSKKLGRPIEVHSGFRTHHQQDRIDTKDGTTITTKSRSQHILGEAADLVVKGISPLELAKAAYEIGLFKRVNLYPKGRVHVDMKKVAKGTQRYYNWNRVYTDDFK